MVIQGQLPAAILECVFKLPKVSRFQQVIITLVAFGLLTLSLVVAGLLDTAARLTAYATVFLAIGTIGLAAGAIGTYIEQRNLARLQRVELDDRTLNEIGQVCIERNSGPGKFLEIRVHNNSSRAIRNVYVWADVEGLKGHYATAVHDDDDHMSRRMSNVPHAAEGGALYWQLRVLLSTHQEVFKQLKHMIDQPVPDVPDSRITAFAEFTDADGTWWRCDETGNVGHPPAAPPLEVQTHPILGTRGINPLARGLTRDLPPPEP
jgi:hypothetical protein